MKYNNTNIEKHQYASQYYEVFSISYTEPEADKEPEKILTLNGWAVRADGSNSYGKISFIVGFGLDKTFKGIYMISDGQTYASTLEENYIDPMNAGNVDYTSDTDVSCGATYGAKLVKAMIEDSKSFVDGIKVE